MRAPDSPTSLNITRSNSKTVYNITWRDGLLDGGRKINNYSIYSVKGKGDYQLLGTFKKQYYEVSAADLSPDTMYSFKVSARNSIGESNLTESVSFKTDRPTALDIPDLKPPAPQFVEKIDPKEFECTFFENSYYGGRSVPLSAKSNPGWTDFNAYSF